MTAIKRRWGLAGGALVLAGLAAGCSGVGPAKPESAVVKPTQRNQPEGTIGDLVGGGLQLGNVTVGNKVKGDAFAGSVNRHLWLASLETLAFLPIISTDPFTGVIATDWGASAETPGERFKVNAFVTSVALEPSSLRVAVYREQQDATGNWVAASVAPETPRQIEDAILTRARQLRLGEATSG